MLSKKTVSRKAPVWVDDGGKKIARIEDDAGWLRISIDKTVDADFGAFVVSQLSNLLRAYRGDRDSG